MNKSIIISRLHGLKVTKCSRVGGTMLTYVVNIVVHHYVVNYVVPYSPSFQSIFLHSVHTVQLCLVVALQEGCILALEITMILSKLYSTASYDQQD